MVQEISVVFRPDNRLRAGNSEERELDSAFSSEIDRWFRIAPAVEGRSIHPPTETHPSGLARVRVETTFHGLLMPALGVASYLLFRHGE
ncbi:hypothetical protein EON82_25775 [bacterium]|nr:MAG: hypothetical protein EON82_25775 [bacterium]